MPLVNHHCHLHHQHQQQQHSDVIGLGSGFSRVPSMWIRGTVHHTHIKLSDKWAHKCKHVEYALMDFCYPVGPHTCMLLSWARQIECMAENCIENWIQNQPVSWVSSFTGTRRSQGWLYFRLIYTYYQMVWSLWLNHPLLSCLHGFPETRGRRSQVLCQAPGSGDRKKKYP